MQGQINAQSAENSTLQVFACDSSHTLGSPVACPYNRRTLFVELVMPNLRLADLTAEIEANVRRALAEDIGSGDITARLIPAEDRTDTERRAIETMTAAKAVGRWPR